MADKIFQQTVDDEGLTALAILRMAIAGDAKKNVFRGIMESIGKGIIGLKEDDTLSTAISEEDLDVDG